MLTHKTKKFTYIILLVGLLLSTFDKNEEENNDVMEQEFANVLDTNLENHIDRNSDINPQRRMASVLASSEVHLRPNETTDQAIELSLSTLQDHSKADSIE